MLDVFAILTALDALGASADARLFALALCAQADAEGRARVWASELAPATGLSKRRLDRVVVELATLGFAGERTGKKGAKTTFDLSPLLTPEKDHSDPSQAEEGSQRSFSKKDHSDPSRPKKDHSDPSSRKTTVILLEGGKGVEKDHSDPSRPAARKTTVRLLDGEKDHSDPSSRVRGRASLGAQQQQHLLKESGGSTRASGSVRAAGDPKATKNGRRTERALEPFLEDYAAEEPREAKERLSGASKGVSDAIDAQAARRIELQVEALRLLEQPNLPLDSFVAASFAAYQRSITPGAAQALASRLLGDVGADRLVRDYVVERLIEHDSGDAGERYGDKGFTSFLMRDAGRWAAERAARAAEIANFGHMPIPTALPRLELEPDHDETAANKLTKEQLEDVTAKLRLH